MTSHYCRDRDDEYWRFNEDSTMTSVDGTIPFAAACRDHGPMLWLTEGSAEYYTAKYAIEGLSTEAEVVTEYGADGGTDYPDAAQAKLAELAEILRYREGESAWWYDKVAAVEAELAAVTRDRDSARASVRRQQAHIEDIQAALARRRKEIAYLRGHWISPERYREIREGVERLRVRLQSVLGIHEPVSDDTLVRAVHDGILEKRRLRTATRAVGEALADLQEADDAAELAAHQRRRG